MIVAAGKRIVGSNITYCTFHVVLFPILLQSLRLCLSNLSDSTVLLF